MGGADTHSLKMARRIHEVDDGRRYIIGDAVTELQNLEESAAIIYLDDAWARPQRAEQFGVEYLTHRFDKSETHPVRDESTTTREILDACKEALEPGGWIIADADDWLLPRLLNYFVEEWGDVVNDYDGGGYRRVGGVTYVTKSNGEPDRSTAGEYLSNGGYPVVFAHKGETDRKTSVSSRQITTRQQENYGWGSVKPYDPYLAWIEGLMEPGEHLVVPCAGTAPAAIAMEIAFGSRTEYTCIDCDPDAFSAFQKRRNAEYVEQHQLDVEY